MKFSFFFFEEDTYRVGEGRHKSHFRASQSHSHFLFMIVSPIDPDPNEPNPIDPDLIEPNPVEPNAIEPNPIR